MPPNVRPACLSQLCATMIVRVSTPLLRVQAQLQAASTGPETPMLEAGVHEDPVATQPVAVVSPATATPAQVNSR